MEPQIGFDSYTLINGERDVIDEYSEVLAQYRPVGIFDDNADSQSLTVYRTIERLVRDARKYHARADLAEDLLNRTQIELQALKDRVSLHVLHGIIIDEV